MSKALVSPVYLLTGSSIASASEIGAKLANTPIDSDDYVLDVVDLFCSQNSLVENIEELAARAKYPPVQCQAKVYILRGVEDLQSEALSYLFTQCIPMAHDSVIFILCWHTDSSFSGKLEMDVWPTVY